MEKESEQQRTESACDPWLNPAALSHKDWDALVGSCQCGVLLVYKFPVRRRKERRKRKRLSCEIKRERERERGEREEKERT